MTINPDTAPGDLGLAPELIEFYGRPRWRLDLPFRTPLSLNDRMHWQVKRKHNAAWRGTARDLARREHIPLLERFTAVLVYQPRDNRPRDVDNLIASLKPLVDGLRDAHVAPDDSTVHYRLTSPQILSARKGEPGRLWLVVIDLSGDPGTQVALPLDGERG